MKLNETEFKEKVKKCLPENILVDGIKYRLNTHGLMTSGYRITYIEFNGEDFNYENKLFDLFYKIISPFWYSIFSRIIYLEDATIYLTNTDDVICDCILKISEKRYEQLD